MIRLARLAALLTACSILASCGPPTHPINPPNASIQQLDVLPDGRWKLQIRLENFSDKTVHYATFKATLRISGMAAADLSLKPEMDIPGENADIVETTISAPGDAQKSFLEDAKAPSGAAYELKGTINIPAAEKDFKFEHKSSVRGTGYTEPISLGEWRPTGAYRCRRRSRHINAVRLAS